MKFTIVCLAAFVVVALAETKYTDKYDGVNFREILENDRLLAGYLSCILDKGPCTAEGKELRSHIQDALETGCEKCTEVQKGGSEEVINHLIEKKPEAWNSLKKKYDPTGKFSKKYEDELARISKKN